VGLEGPVERALLVSLGHSYPALAIAALLAAPIGTARSEKASKTFP
jgi:hypothetical protein